MFGPDRRLATCGTIALCLIAGVAVAGPSGLMSWSETLRQRDVRAAQLATLEEQRTILAHRVGLLSPDAADPDLVSELIRKDLNVVRPDELVILLDESEP